MIKWSNTCKTLKEFFFLSLYITCDNNFWICISSQQLFSDSNSIFLTSQQYLSPEKSQVCQPCPKPNYIFLDATKKIPQFFLYIQSPFQIMVSAVHDKVETIFNFHLHFQLFKKTVQPKQAYTHTFLSC